MEKACAKFQQKYLTLTELELLKVFSFIQAISKLCLNFCMRISLLNLALSGCQGCSQTNGMGAHTKFVQKNQQSIFFFTIALRTTK